MAVKVSRFRSAYGAGPLHLLVVVASLALAAYTVSVLGIGELWDPDVWWQSVLVWFAGAVLLHDVVLFPVYALADRLLGRVLGRRRGLGRELGVESGVSPLNHVRVPALAIGLLLVLFLPGIIEQGGPTYLHATGQTQEPFLERWLVLSAVICAVSAVVYAVRVARRRTAVRRGGSVGSSAPEHPADQRHEERQDTEDSEDERHG